jgi:flavin reductase (DIM6/NTAB) family NADH-FMN oxidoreductase RutF
MMIPLGGTDDPVLLRHAFSCFPSGVAALCGSAGGEPTGMAASTFTSVSLDPPLVSVCLDNASRTWPKLRRLPGLGISVLGESHAAACRRLAATDADRFVGIPWVATPRGAVLIHGATSWLECTLFAELPAGDHVIALLQVLAVEFDRDAAPLIFHASRFRRFLPEPSTPTS